MLKLLNLWRMFLKASLNRRGHLMTNFENGTQEKVLRSKVYLQ